MIKRTEHRGVSRETVRRRLEENGLKPWRRDLSCIPQVDAEYVARMEAVLDLYAQAHDPNRPVVSFDEGPTQRIGAVREPWRHVPVTEQRSALDFAGCLRDLTNVHSPEADLNRVGLDNLTTHVPPAPNEASPAEEARGFLRRLEFLSLPKHESWLSRAELDLGVLEGKRLARCVENKKTHIAEVAAWTRARDKAKARVSWMFTTEKARSKLRPDPTAVAHFARDT